MAAIGGLLPVVLYGRTPLHPVAEPPFLSGHCQASGAVHVRSIPGGAFSLRYRAAPEGAATAVAVEKVMGS